MATGGLTEQGIGDPPEEVAGEEEGAQQMADSDVENLCPKGDALRLLRWRAAQRRIAQHDAVKNHPRRLSALYLTHARGSRLAAAADRHPGREWWVRSALASLSLAASQRTQVST